MHNTEKKDGAVISKPKLVIDYNDTMGAVYCLDQNLHDYLVKGKGVKNILSFTRHRYLERVCFVLKKSRRKIYLGI